MAGRVKESRSVPTEQPLRCRTCDDDDPGRRRVPPCCFPKPCAGRGVRRMASHELLSLLPLVLASLVPACLVVGAFLVSREGSRFLSVASFVTTLAAGLTYLAVIIRPLLSFAGYDAR